MLGTSKPVTGLSMAALGDSLTSSPCLSRHEWMWALQSGSIEKHCVSWVIYYVQVDKRLQGSGDASRDELAAPQTWIPHQFFFLFFLFQSVALELRNFKMLHVNAHQWR